MNPALSEVQWKQSGGLAYLERRGTGAPILLLHGNGFSKEVFANQFLSKGLQDFPLIAVDLPGHGDSANASDPAGTYCYSGFAREIFSFISRIGLKDCIVAGWSLGGQVALEMICETSPVAGVMAFGAPPAPSGPVGIIRSMHFSKTLLLAGKGEFSSDDAAYFEKACLTDFSDGRFVKTLMRTDPTMRPNLSKSVLGLGARSQRDRLAASVIPVCLLHGRRDPLVRTAYMSGLEEECLFTRSVVVDDNAAHAPFLESQENFDCLLAEFAKFASSRNTASGFVHQKIANSTAA